MQAGPFTMFLRDLAPDGFDLGQNDGRLAVALGRSCAAETIAQGHLLAPRHQQQRARTLGRIDY